MHQEKYQLLVSGKTVPGMSLAQVAGNLVNGFNFNTEQVKQLLGGKPRVIKTTQDLDGLKRLRDKFLAAGVNCKIQRAAAEGNKVAAPNKPAVNAKRAGNGSKLQLSATAEPARAILAFRAFDFIPKLFSKSAYETAIDSNNNPRFHVRRDKVYLGWLFLFPVGAIVVLAIILVLAKIMLSLFDSIAIVSLMSIFEFLVVWVLGVLYARPTSVIDIVDINRNEEIFVLQQTQRLFFRHKQFILATDLESLNATINYDQIQDQCRCESMDGLIVYQSTPQHAKPNISTILSDFRDYFKDIPARLFPASKTCGAKTYNVLNHENRLVGSFAVGKDIIIKSNQADTNTAYLLSMALACAGA